MPQTSLYMDTETMELIRKKSQESGVSLSKYIAHAVTYYADQKVNDWPRGFWEESYGCLDDATAKEMLASRDCFDAVDPSLDDSCNWFSTNE